MARRFLVDVDLKRSLLADGSAGTSGYVLKSQGANQPPIWAVESGGGGTGAYTISSTPPGSPASGDMWFDLDTGAEFTYINDGDSSQWVEAAPPVIGGGSGGTVDVDPVIAGMVF